MNTCSICGRIGGEVPFVLPSLCMLACARVHLGRTGVAHLFPEIAEPADELALREQENMLLKNCTSSPRFVGMLAGKIWKDRDERSQRWREHNIKTLLQQPVCSGCKQEIDPDCCGCGAPRENHGSPMDVGHDFIPMGCDCLRSRSDVV